MYGLICWGSISLAKKKGRFTNGFYLTSILIPPVSLIVALFSNVKKTENPSISPLLFYFHLLVGGLLVLILRIM